MKYIFLDFNGTVLDDVDLCLELLNKVLEKTNKQAIDLNRYKEVFGFPIKDYYIKAGVDLNLVSYEDLSDFFIKEYQPRSMVECKLYDDVETFIDKAHKLGYKVVLCSASMKVLLVEQIKSFGIYEKFDDVLGLDNHHAASKIQIAKDYVKTHLKENDELFFIGDTDHDAETAIEIGATPILVSRGHQSEKILSEASKYVEPTLLKALDKICLL